MTNVLFGINDTDNTASYSGYLYSLSTAIYIGIYLKFYVEFTQITETATTYQCMNPSTHEMNSSHLNIVQPHPTPTQTPATPTIASTWVCCWVSKATAY